MLRIALPAPRRLRGRRAAAPLGPLTRRGYRRSLSGGGGEQHGAVDRGDRGGSRLYVLGEGWTGALGTGRVDDAVRGHDDDKDGDIADRPLRVLVPPVPAPDGTENGGASRTIRSVAVGWGHTAVITGDADGDARRLWLTGRSQEFASLLRLRRLPRLLRDAAVRAAVREQQQSRQRPSLEEKVDPAAGGAPSLTGRLLSWFTDAFLEDRQREDWEAARLQSMPLMLTPVALPEGDVPEAVACSAGLTAVVTASGTLYAWGLNGYGQCGLGHTSNNVWTPQRVPGLACGSGLGPDGGSEPSSSSIVDVRLGLQHALCLNADGDVFAFGKGDRGQLGREPLVMQQSQAAPVDRFMTLELGHLRASYHPLPPVRQIAAGMLHSAALDMNNQVYVWGKHTLPKDLARYHPGIAAADAQLPCRLPGLPKHREVLAVACGSHHTAVLLEDGAVWAVGVASDTRVPLHEPVCLVPPGVLELPVCQFAAHMDRTTVVGRDGRQVLQVHLWSDPELREYAAFTPPWLDRLLEEDPQARVRSVHRGWIHTAVVVD